MLALRLSIEFMRWNEFLHSAFFLLHSHLRAAGNHRNRSQFIKI